MFIFYRELLWKEQDNRVSVRFSIIYVIICNQMLTVASALFHVFFINLTILSNRYLQPTQRIEKPVRKIGPPLKDTSYT